MAMRCYATHIRALWAEDKAAFLWCDVQLRLATVLPFLAGALQGLGEQRRSVAIVRSLRRAGHLAARSDLVHCKQRCASQPHSLQFNPYAAFSYHGLFMRCCCPELPAGRCAARGYGQASGMVCQPRR
jgi:hypothetical protein